VQARDIMTSPVITFRPDTSVRHAATVLTEHAIAAAPVVDADDQIVGMVSESDLIAHRFPHDPRHWVRRDQPETAEPDPPQSVGEVMTSPAVTAPENTDAADLAETMVTRNVRSIPIVIGRSVVGIVSRRDLLRTLVRDDTAIAAQVRQRIETYTGALVTWRIDVENGRVRITGPIADDDEQVLLILARTVPGVIDVGLHRTRTPAQG